ncbi:MAG: hypothetical protein ABFS12_13900 [Bacteroidota bacterium]
MFAYDLHKSALYFQFLISSPPRGKTKSLNLMESIQTSTRVNEAYGLLSERIDKIIAENPESERDENLINIPEELPLLLTVFEEMGIVSEPTWACADLGWRMLKVLRDYTNMYNDNSDRVKNAIFNKWVNEWHQLF